MRWRSIGLLALLLAGVAGAYYGLEAKGKKSDDATRLFRADEKDIGRISIKKSGGQVVLEREGDRWRLIQPVQAKADSSEMASLLQTILAAKQERTIDEQGKNLGEYGLEKPTIQLTLSVKGDKPPLVLLLGDKNPNGFSVYAKRGDQPAVSLVAESLRARLDRKAADFRDKTLLALEPDKVKQVELVRKGQSITVSNAGADKWELTQPFRARADAGAIRQVLWSIKGARIRDFLASGADAKRRYGFDQPDMTVALNEAGTSKRLLLKKALDPKVGLYAMAEPGEGVVTTDARLLADLSKSPLDLRDRSLLRFETRDVRAIKVVKGGQSVTVAREGDLWKLTSPIKADAQAGKVYDLLYALKELRYTELVQEKRGDLSQYGLKAPQAEVEVSTTDGSPLPALLFGKSEKDRLYAKLASDPAVYAIDPKFLDKIPSGAEALKQETKAAAGK